MSSKLDKAMCDLLTFAVPERGGSALQPDEPTAFSVISFRNVGGSHSYGPGFIVSAAMSGGCSCGMFPETIKETENPHLAGLRRKYERLGWSSARVARALADAERAAKSSRGQPLSTEVFGYLRQLVERCGELRLICHAHDGPFATETFEVHGPISLAPGELVNDKIKLLRDHLYIVTESKPGRPNRHNF